MAKKEYQSKATPTFIEAHSRISVKMQDTFYTFEFVERRDLPQDKDVNIEKEKELLWKDVHAQVDMQVQDVVDMLKQGR